MKPKTTHPRWALAHRKPGTELKLINGNYYLNGVKSIYDKVNKRSKKISLGIIERITQEKGLIPSGKNELKQKSEKTYLNKQVFSFEYGLSKWLFDTVNTKLQSMSTLAIMHNTDLNPKEIYLECKNRGEIEQFFDH